MTVRVLERRDLAGCDRWRDSFSRECKDNRYYELVEDTLKEGFEYRYFAVLDDAGRIAAIQPFFLLTQDLATGAGPKLAALVRGVRRAWPGFLQLRTLMVGCVAGEAHLDTSQDADAEPLARLLSAEIEGHARQLGARLVVLKEFPARYRAPLEEFVRRGFTRIPSMPMTRLNIDYASFDDYMTRALNSATRKKLRKKFGAAAAAPPIELKIVDDIEPIIDEIYPLYLQVYRRSRMHFEKLSKDYLCGLGQKIGGKARFFVWRQGGTAVAFCACLLQGDSFHAEYVGFDYEVALDQHLYHYIVRDMISWAIGRKLKWFRSTGLNYDPKLHLRHQLDPVDLYVKHTCPVRNSMLRRLLPWLAPVRQDKTLPKFANYRDLWADDAGPSRPLKQDERRVAQSVRKG